MNKPKISEIPIESIDIGQRARKNFDEAKLDELANSIDKYGQLQNITVLVKDGNEESMAEVNQPENDKKPYLLLSGERRILALQSLGKKFVNALIRKDLTYASDILEIEWHENYFRDSLTWDEELDLKERIYNRRLKEGRKDLPDYIEEDKENLVDESESSMRDTAEYLGESVSNLSEDLKLAEALREVPELKNMKNKSQAKKILDSVDREIETEEKIKNFKESPENTREIEEISKRYILKDCVEFGDTLEDESIDFIEMDPNLPIAFGDDQQSNAHYKESNDTDYEESVKKLIRIAERVLTPKGWVLIWTPIERSFIFEELVKSNFIENPIPIVWDRSKFHTRSPKKRLGNGYEIAYYARRSTETRLNKYRSNVFNVKTPDRSTRIHPTEKPVELYEELMDAFIPRGSQCWSTFAGSGNMILAGVNTQRHVIGNDLSNHFKNKFTLRLKENINAEKFSSYDTKN